MSRKKNKKGKELGGAVSKTTKEPLLTHDTKKSIWAIVFFGFAAILALAAIGKAGPFGVIIYEFLKTLFGWGYFILPISLVFAAIVLLFSGEKKIISVTIFGVGLLILSSLGIVELASSGHGGWLGVILGSLKIPFGKTAGIVINIFILIIAILISANTPLKIGWLRKKENNEEKNGVMTEEEAEKIQNKIDQISDKDKKENEKETDEEKINEKETETEEEGGLLGMIKKVHKKPQNIPNYTPPPLSLLKSTNDKPTTGDLLANANIIKRTLDSFGIPVEMGEINVGPSVTRYTLKPAEGVKLSRIESLHKDLALSLAAHPIRIEAPIPGKSLVGIEVPNKAAALVRLGSMLNYPDFQKSGNLVFPIGRDVSGDPVFSDIEKMPHLLVAGATGSGKSILIHSILTSLLYKNSPSTLKLVMVDPKRVELSVYEGIPHLVSPVVTESKKAIGVFKWALQEMDRRYDTLLQAGSRDIKSYNQNSGKEDPLSYIVIIVDELADLMTSYGRDVEGSIVRLAQMARATGIHLILSTQRPSVEVITGLIKANITSRVALQVASQIDSRTILDTSGAEKLLGHGDLLFISSELSKPKRIQGAYITEEEVKKVADFIRKNNKEAIEEKEEINFPVNGNRNSNNNGQNENQNGISFDDYLTDENGDELYDEAMEVIREAQKASASLLQRRLKVGYARAARLLDLMEENNIIGPGEGAKPREVYIEKNPEGGFG